MRGVVGRLNRVAARCQHEPQQSQLPKRVGKVHSKRCRSVQPHRERGEPISHAATSVEPLMVWCNARASLCPDCNPQTPSRSDAAIVTGANDPGFRSNCSPRGLQPHYKSAHRFSRIFSQPTPSGNHMELIAIRSVVADLPGESSPAVLRFEIAINKIESFVYDG